MLVTSNCHAAAATRRSLATVAPHVAWTDGPFRPRTLPARRPAPILRRCARGARVARGREQAGMASQSSFDIVSKFDEQELRNAVDQTLREVRTRFDLKDSKTELTQEDEQLLINTDSEMSLRAIKDLFES